jgi:hypothetical protein
MFIIKRKRWSTIPPIATNTFHLISLDRMIVGFTTTCTISAYQHYICEFKSRSWRGVLDTTLRDKVFQRLATGRSFSPVSSSNKTDRRNSWNIIESVAKLHSNNTNIIEHKQISIYDDGLDCDRQKNVAGLDQFRASLIFVLI